MRNLLVAGLLILLCSGAQAHLWYPEACCSGEDCDVVIRKVQTPKGTLITTSKGTALFHTGFQILPSQDGREHACMSPDGYEIEEGQLKMRALCWFQRVES